MPLTLKVPLLILLLTVSSMYIVGYLAYREARDAIKEDYYHDNEIAATTAVSKAGFYAQGLHRNLQLMTHNETLHIMLRDYANGTTTLEALRDIYTNNQADLGSDHWSTAIGSYGTVNAELTEFMRTLELYDVFLIAPNGDIIFTVIKEDDFATNLVTGRYSSSHLGSVFRDSLNRRGLAFADFEPYGPSADQSAAFVAHPIVEDDETIGVLAIQMPIEPLVRRLSTDYLGSDFRTLEMIGSDGLVRLTSTGTTNRMLSTRHASELLSLAKQSNGTSVASLNIDAETVSISPIDFFGREWFVISRSPDSYLADRTGQLAKDVLLLAMLVSILSLIAGLMISRSIVEPLVDLRLDLRHFSRHRKATESELSKRSDEVGSIARTISQMEKDLEGYIAGMHEKELDLSESNEEINALLNGAPDAIFVVNRDGLITRVNQAAVDLFGYTRNELTDSPIEKLTPLEHGQHEQLRNEFFSDLKLFQLTRRKDGSNFEAVHKSGELFPVDIRLSPIKSAKGDLVVTSVRDVRERVAFEERLKNNEQQLKLILEIGNIPIAILARDESAAEVHFTVLYHNPAFAQLDEEQDNFIGKEIEFLDIETRSALFEKFQREGQIRDHLVEFQKNGKSVQISAFPLRYEGRDSILLMAIDMTERIQQEIALAKNAQIMSMMQSIAALANSTTNSITMMRDSVKIVCEELNWEAGRLLVLDNILADEVINASYWYADTSSIGMKLVKTLETTGESLISSPAGRTIDTRMVEYIRSQRLEAPNPLEAQVIDAGINLMASLPIVVGEKCYGIIELFTSENIAPDQQLLEAFMQVGRDIALVGERVEFTEELQKARHTAESATRAKASFLANMSHEMRTPMNAIMGMSHLAMQAELPKKQTEQINIVYQSAESLLGIINDLLDFSKIEAGKLDIEVIDFSLTDVITHVCNLVKVRISEKNLELILFEGEDVPLKLKGDPLRLGQILTNLTNNAVKFTENGEIHINVSVQERSEHNATLLFEVKDTGIGMTDAQMGKLFTSFSQADTSTTREFGGTGLGLAISKQLVELMGGSIGVSSTQGEGSCFYFSIPFEISESNQRIVVPDFLNDLKVLVIDHNDAVLNIVRDMLTGFGTNPTIASSLETAVQTADSSIDLLLLDQTFATAESEEALLELEGKLGDNTEVIFLCSSNAETAEASSLRAFQAHAESTLEKPVSPSHLLEAILQAFNESTEMVSRSQVDDQRARAQIAGAHFLLVEDNEVNQMLAVELLKAVTDNIDVANNGEEAVQKATSGTHYDCVLMDCQMPVMDGYKATEIIREQVSADELPILAMTANAMRTDVERALEAGMDDHIAKPIEIDKFYVTLAKWINPENRPIETDPAASTPPTAESTATTAATTAEEAPATLPDIEGIDTAAGLKRVVGNTDLYLKLLRQFAEKQRHFMDRFTAAQEDTDPEAATREAHTLKSVAGSLGIDMIYKEAAELEQACKRADESAINRQLGAIFGILPYTVANIEAALADDSAAATTQAALSAEDLAAEFDQLEALLAEDDVAARSIVDEIKGRVPADMIDALSQIEKAIGQYDFDDALEVLRSIKS